MYSQLNFNMESPYLQDGVPPGAFGNSNDLQGSAFIYGGGDFMHQAPWSHVIPPAMPWAPSAPPNFLSPFMMETTAGMQPMRPKRKLFPEENVQPAKQYISEERMAAHFNEMQISNEYSHPKSPMASGSRTCSGKGSIRSLQELEARLAESDIDDVNMTNPTGVVLSPELQKLAKTDSLLPKAILEEIRKPSMEIVLWKPPGGIVPNIIASKMEKKMVKLSEDDVEKKRDEPKSTEMSSSVAESCDVMMDI